MEALQNYNFNKPDIKCCHVEVLQQGLFSQSKLAIRIARKAAGVENFECNRIKQN